ncbi:MAG: MGMT family protein, partial [Microbacteriaceae bacterium]|nr:MGMT family protein [Microbacteriaceae bacterium]
GGAVGKNPIPIIIPCHRILASNQRITGYSGGEGIPTKVALLELEGISYR